MLFLCINNWDRVGTGFVISVISRSPGNSPEDLPQPQDAQGAVNRQKEKTLEKHWPWFLTAATTIAEIAWIKKQETN